VTLDGLNEVVPGGLVTHPTAEVAPLQGDLVFYNVRGITEVATDSKALMSVINAGILGGCNSQEIVDGMTRDGRLFDVANGTRATLIQTEDSGGTFGKLIAVLLTSGNHSGKRLMTFEKAVQKGNY
jgi:hypothetical protein